VLDEELKRGEVSEGQDVRPRASTLRCKNSFKAGCPAHPPHFSCVSFDTNPVPGSRLWVACRVAFQSDRPSALGPASLFHEARFTDSRSVYKREVDSSARVDLGAAFATHFLVRLVH
jgi:hypothetical protein